MGRMVNRRVKLKGKKKNFHGGSRSRRLEAGAILVLPPRRGGSGA